MIVQLAVSMVVLWAPQDAAEYPWPRALQRLAPHMAGFKASDDNPGQNAKRLTALIEKLGLQPRDDPRTHKPIDGLGIREDGVLPVGGEPGAILALVTWGHPKDSEHGGGFSPTLFRRTGGKWDFESFADDSEVFPRHAALVGGTLVVSGLADWMSNGANVAVRSYRYKDGAWKPVATKIAEYESWDPPKLRLAKDGNSLLPIRFQSRTYPKHLDACHATAHLTYDEEWAFPHGRPALVWKRLRDTPYNTLDRLYAAIKRKDAAAIRRHSRNASIAQRLIALHRRALSGKPSVSFPNSFSFGDAKVLGIENLRTTFHFGRSRGRWVVTRLGPASESM